MTALSALAASNQTAAEQSAVAADASAVNSTQTGHQPGEATSVPARGRLRFAQADPALLEQAFPVPTGREEVWRFTPLPALGGLAQAATPELAEQQVSMQVTPQTGVTVERESRSDARVGQTSGPVDFVAARAWSHTEQATIVSIEESVDAQQPVQIKLSGGGASGASYGHLLIDVAAHTQATVLLQTEGAATYADNVEIRVGDNAQLTILGVLDWLPGSVHVGAHSLSLGAGASVRHGVVSLGGSVVRMSTNVHYAAAGGQASLLGLYVANADQHLENRLFVDHEQPHCKSRVEYKGALLGKSARTVWIGDVLIRASAEGTDTYELNRNLVLVPGAQADSVPNLEIETGEIAGAGHASATGRFDDEQLFYLMARGIDRTQARRLVVRGFFADLLGQLGMPEVAQRLLEQIERNLSSAFETSAALGSASDAPESLDADQSRSALPQIPATQESA